MLCGALLECRLCMEWLLLFLREDVGEERIKHVCLVVLVHLYEVQSCFLFNCFCQGCCWWCVVLYTGIACKHWVLHNHYIAI